MTGEHISKTPEHTFELGIRLSESLAGGEVILLSGGLGAGKTLLTKGILNGLKYDVDEVTSPSFTLVNLYKTEQLDVYHIDLWRLEEKTDIAQAVGLDEILDTENAVVIIEWAEKLQNFPFSGNVIRVRIEGDGDEPRRVEIEREAEANKF